METLQGAAQFPADIAVTEPIRTLPGNNDKVRGEKEAFIVAIEFPDQPLETVSYDRIADLAAHGYPQSNGGNG